jgi:hypothetical protein
MAPSMTTSITARRNSYTAYSIGCAVVWAVILVATDRCADAQTRDKVRTTCGGWWMGWTSATIARVVYPPPKKTRSTLTPV